MSVAPPISNPAQQLNSYTTNIKLKDLLDSYKDATSISINCHHIGTIQAFDATTQTASATINYSKTYFKFDNLTNSNVPVQINYPLLLMCPVIFLSGGPASLTFPIAQGDECLILFNDRSLDNWYQSGSGSPVNSPRLHSISDGIILVGLKSFLNRQMNYDTARAVLRNNTSAVGVNGSKVLITNTYVGTASPSTTLNTLLQTLITDLQTLITQVAAITVTGVTTGSGISGIPTNAAAIAAVSSSLSSLATQIGGLLE